ncbi:hypothetical protein K439DRAFT_1642638 [Ramaria rubella]|nr:hypothetical protein K439DRAFT_1642638 [Ramaria rubella]
MQFLQIASLMLLALVPQLALAQDATPCCNPILPPCPTPPLPSKFGHGPVCCPGDEPRC